MDKLPRWPRQRSRALLQWAQKTSRTAGDPGLLLRAQVVAQGARGRTVLDICEVLGCVRSFVYKVADRFVAGGRDGLLDQRTEKPSPVVTDDVLQWVEEFLQYSPEEYGYPRPTWTRELMAVVLEEQSGAKLSLASMGRALKRVGARLGRPKPIVKSPLSERQIRRRKAAIRSLIENLPEDEVVVFEDEVDVHLNPKIGLDWMPKGTQKQVLTPGKNQKAYVAGSLDARDGTVLWVGEAAKNSELFVKMLEKLDDHYSKAKVIHVIVDNYSIHHSQETKEALSKMPRIKLVFLPPYSPDMNPIERFWQDLHANVTRNHRHETLRSLCMAVAAFLNAATPWLPGACPGWEKVMNAAKA